MAILSCTVPDATSNECVACGANSIVAGDKCVTCGLGKVANPRTNTCDDCVSDAVVQWTVGERDRGCYPTRRIPIKPQGSVDDNCPDQFWLELPPVDAFFTAGVKGVTVEASETGAGGLEKEWCVAEQASLDVTLRNDVGRWFLASSTLASGKFAHKPFMPNCIVFAALDVTPDLPNWNVYGVDHNHIRVRAFTGLGSQSKDGQMMVTETGCHQIIL